ncbi:DoxX family protein [Methylomonas sp. UP202]|uniref:HvfX family Cu-binding RiPP maturation protein n=1 Tax=Methylomonas sp. UP202 TaxID=3040943 RepID=UPI00143ADC6C|nr:DoxX family protein [Methylomonas sp. UP202]NJA06854.1 DoxX family protein [Methylococcaceae bacterium WWC4]WGS87997.1 DoxX family protein [Methylomonas sp. UP202]
MNNTTFATLMNMAAEKVPVAARWCRRACDAARCLDFLAPLLIRLYLAPVFWMAGTKKFANFTDTAAWFGNAEWGLGLPAPYVLVFLVAFVETFGALFLVFGFATRVISLPLSVIMVVAAVTAHWQNGWLAIATGSGLFATDRTVAAIERLDKAKEILQAQGDYAYLTEFGSLAMLNNGIEFAATYFVLLVALFFLGGGRYVSADYWLKRKYLID